MAIISSFKFLTIAVCFKCLLKNEQYPDQGFCMNTLMAKLNRRRMWFSNIRIRRYNSAGRKVYYLD
jgi:hypothetical protein